MQDCIGCFYTLLLFVFNKNISMSIPIGNNSEKPNPTDMLLLNLSDTNPTNNGPTVHPVSPAKANNPKIDADEPKCAAARLSVPGQKIATAKPHNAIPINDSKGIGENAAIV